MTPFILFITKCNKAFSSHFGWPFPPQSHLCPPLPTRHFQVFVPSDFGVPIWTHWPVGQFESSLPILHGSLPGPRMTALVTPLFGAAFLGRNKRANEGRGEDEDSCLVPEKCLLKLFSVDRAPNEGCNEGYPQLQDIHWSATFPRVPVKSLASGGREREPLKPEFLQKESWKK